MTPDDQNDRRVGTPLVPQRPYLHTDIPARDADASRDAVANITRTQLDSIYQRTPVNTTQPVADTSKNKSPANTETAPAASSSEAANPYERTHTDTVTTLQADQWNKYHSAWQEYYQKYYERYYASQVQQTLAAQSAATPPSDASASESLSKNEAMDDLRSRLQNTLKAQASKVRQSRHFVPIVAATAVMLLFLFLQYNRILFANVQAYVSPGNVNPVNFIVDPTTSLAVSPEPKLIIPKINVDVPVNYDTTPDYNSQMAAMQNGVAYFGIPGANSKPGQVGNTVLSGHSSNDIIDKGDYKFIFARLDQVDKGDAIYVNYQGKRYTYTVTKKSVVAPTDVQALVYPTTKPILTLITCTPLGTSLNRLLVTAEQVSPDPAAAAAAPAVSADTTATSIPGSSPTFLERIFGGGQN
jgi:sortase A